ncbi:extracellular solute-binding protein [Natronobiforma cellulositropha]|uniref:extracellular solute-binding protein n=1 Tax=Natronobiforma cellulositropha TaxID=1679076 RepID=UPI0021D5D197|nr:extracellular solute-binding protein [Natronobiforma cellulositropha]
MNERRPRDGDLEAELDDDFLDDFYWNVIDRYRVRDELGMISYAYATIGVTYNEALLAEAGYDTFPETWSEFRDDLEGIQAETDVDYPLVEEGSGTTAAWIWYPWVAANGGDIMNEDRTECIAASEENVEALEFFQELREAELVGTLEEVGAETKWSILNQEQAAMVTGGGWVPGTTKDQYPDFYEQVGVARPPRPDDGEYGNLVFGAGYAVSANSDHVDLSVDLVQYMLGDGLLPYLEAGVAQPIRQYHTDQLDLYDEDERFQPFLDANDDRLIDWQWGPHSQEIFNELYPQIEGVIHGEVDAREALETAQQRVNDNVLDG